MLYLYNGVVQKYRPDFLVGLTTATTLVLKVKGQDSRQNEAKRQALAEWVRAVNLHGGFGHWASDVSYQRADIADILARHAAQAD